jgi:hypothetical protein
VQTRQDSPFRGVALRVGVLVVLVLTAVGLRAGSPADASSTGWDAHDLLHGIGTGLQIALLLWVVTVLVVLVVSRGGQEAAPLHRRRNSFATFLLLVSAAVAVRFFPDLNRGHSLPDTVDLKTVKPHAGAGAGAAQTSVNWVAVTVVVLAALLAAELLRRARRRSVVVADEEPPPDALGEGLAAAARSLRQTADLEPRERVVVAYAAFEDALAARGVARGSSGTPTVLLDRAVEAGAPASAAAALTRLFGVARFGIDPVTAGDVAAAERALADLLAVR